MSLTIEQQRAIAMAKARKRKTEAQEQPKMPAAETVSEPDFDWSFGGISPIVAMAGVGAATESLAGLWGIATSIFKGPEAGAQAVEDIRSLVRLDPEENVANNMRILSDKLKPVTDVFTAAEEGLGEAGYELAGPVGGAVGKTMPTAAAQLVSYGTARGAKKVVDVSRRFRGASPDAASGAILESGARFDVPVMTTDVLPPKTFLGRWSQKLSEKLGPLGTGPARASQQAARETAVREFAEQFDIDLDSPFAANMLNSINKKLASELEAAGAQRNAAVNSLNQFGDVPMTRTISAIDEQLAKQASLKGLSDKSLIAWLNNTKESLSGDFSQIRNIRTEVIRAKNTAGGVSAGALPDAAKAPAQAVKSAMDKDMMAFARANDRQAAADWIRSNRAFSEAYTRVKDTELKSMLARGEATPELITSVLKRGRPSELNRLYKSMGESGRESARRSIIQEALKESKFFEADANPNPNAFATAMNKANRQQAVNVFFKGDAKKEIEGLTRLLNATREAQTAGVVLKTGEQNLISILAAMAGWSAYANPGLTIVGIAAGSAIAKAYESTKFRNLLLKLSNTPKGSRVETGLLEAAAAAVVAELQAAKTEQQQTQEKETP